MAGALEVDGFDLGQLGLVVHSDLRGWRDGVARLHSSEPLPARLGEVRTTVERQAEGRSLVVTGTQRSVDGTVQSLLDRRDELLYRLDRADEIQVVFSDRADRFFRARLDGRPQVRGLSVAALAQEWHRVEIPLYCEDPRVWEATEDQQVVADTDGDTPLTLGSAPTPPTVEVDQPTFTLTYKTAGGVVVATLQVAGASTTPVTVDMGAQTIVTSNGGEIDTRVAGTEFFQLDPQDGQAYAATPTYPTVAVSSSAGAVSSTWTWRKAWL